MRSKHGGDGGTGVYMWEGTTSRVTAADRPYGEFYGFYSVSPENFGSTHVCHYIAFSTRSHSNEKWLLASSCPRVAERLSLEFDMGDFMEICRGGPDFGKVGNSIERFRRSSECV